MPNANVDDPDNRAWVEHPISNGAGAGNRRIRLIATRVDRFNTRTRRRRQLEASEFASSSTSKGLNGGAM
jgi:hypothetical protein